MEQRYDGLQCVCVYVYLWRGEFWCFCVRISGNWVQWSNITNMTDTKNRTINRKSQRKTQKLRIQQWLHNESERKLWTEKRIIETICMANVTEFILSKCFIYFFCKFCVDCFFFVRKKKQYTNSTKWLYLMVVKWCVNFLVYKRTFTL